MVRTCGLAWTVAAGVPACAGGGDAGGPAATAPPAGAAKLGWTPSALDTFQWQLANGVDTAASATVYDVDAFDTPSATVALLHARGRHVVCYVNAGAYETYRSDAASFPAAVIGRRYAGYPDESWLDVRRIDLLAPIMTARVDLCRAKGFDAVEPDNVDGFQNDTGFPLTARDQSAYDRWFAGLAHARGLAVALKNDGQQVADLLPAFDFALTEDCWKQGTCADFAPFARAGKAVFTVEYTDAMDVAAFRANVCARAKAANFFALLKNRTLDAFRETCP
ncbi:MAG: endo alpha-1,4 polygalactosaminidase [Vulcanimicrobiaceae bacterium]